ncbi:hypothetical protein FS749_004133 [Ceratobasidium sp. UAMH 11750]|nr:hypothetical protein FS749_004133 [Ceratobasidium sp. UAMH 11750]
MAGPRRASRTQQHNGSPYNRLPPSSSVAPQSPPVTDDLDTDRSPLPTIVRQVTRTVAMFWSPRAALNSHTKLERAIADGSEETLRATASPADKINFEVCDALERLQPDLFELLATKDGHFARNVRSQLSDGRSGAKAEDNNKVKNAIVHWRTWSPPLVNVPKSSRGVVHLECARRLAPITVNWDDVEERRQFIECSNPPMIASHWPSALYLNESGDPKQPSKGLFQGQLLVDAAKAILESPSSVLPSTSARPGTVRRGRKGIGHKYQLDAVTPAFLAYVAVIVRFALSSEETFSDDGGTFNYVDFYTQLRQYLEAPKYQNSVKPLLAWWNKKLFSNSIQSYNEVAGEGPVGTLSLLDAEVEAEENVSGDENEN